MSERAKAPAPPPGPGTVLSLQRLAGNQATARLLTGGRGQALPGSARHQMESMLGSDFSSVRVRSEAPRHPDALASTRGEEISLRPGLSFSDPATAPALAHELTHVLQNRAGRINESARPGLESEAHSVDRAVRLGTRPPVVSGTGLPPAMAQPLAELNIVPVFLAPAVPAVTWYVRTCLKKYVTYKIGQNVKDEMTELAEQAVEKVKAAVEPTYQQAQEYLDTIKRIYSLARAIEHGIQFAAAAAVSPAAMALAEAVGIEDPELISTITSVSSQIIARTALWFLLEKHMLTLAENLDLTVQQARTGVVEGAMSSLDKVTPSAQVYDTWKSIDHYAFLRFFYKEHPASAVELLDKARSGVQGVDATLSGFSVEARQLAKSQLRVPSLAGAVGFSVIGELVYGGIQMKRGKEEASKWTAGKYLARGVGAGLGTYAMGQLSAWALPLAFGVTTGPVIFIPALVLGGIGSYMGRKVFQSAYESTPLLWQSFSQWMWPAPQLGTVGGEGSGGGFPPAPPGNGPAPMLMPSMPVPRPLSLSGDGGGERDHDRPEQEPQGVTVPTGPRTTTALTPQQIQMILLRQRVGLSNYGLIAPLVPTWQLLIGSGLAGPSVGLAMGLTGRPVEEFLPTSMRTPQIKEMVGRFPPLEIEEEADSVPTPQPDRSDMASMSDASGQRQGFSPEQQKRFGMATGKSVDLLGDLLVTASKTRIEEE